MKTLKAFIFKIKEFQEVMSQTPNLSNTDFTSTEHHLKQSEEFGVIENEDVTSRDFNNLTLSGSLFSLTTFVDVSFNSCIFFATRIENCNFINCQFNNCTFEFSNCSYNCFKESTFNGSSVSYTSFKKNNFKDSSLPIHLLKRFKKDNKLVNSRQIIPFSHAKNLENETKTLFESIIFKKFVA